jgi:small subunit ribosomal protein S18|uniref:Ribosomal protein S18 n=1 Tax=Thorea hispida TaxID=202687 RepID=A0A1C9CAD2_9FLOR|nr:ribosomal protein S18 [Thorea hispida]AOM65327.1 ribosomal protein S18 [Thorea hispida]ARX95887.1 30S ribosomal protein S18 [Thorea hispida]UNJ79172.1 ribosomal protein S18 [Thorea hispida]
MIVYNKKNSPLKETELLDYKDIDLLRKFITDQGKILPRRLTGLTTKQQNKLTKAIKQARILALLPFLNKD